MTSINEPVSIVHSLWRRCVAEFVGTFALVFAGAGAIVINDMTGGGVTHVGIALTFGLIVMAMIYALGDISGAHMNPAVTIGFAVAGRFDFKAVPLYVASQLIGALSASAAMLAIFGNHASLGATIPAGPAWQSFWLETFLTCGLMLVILRLSNGPKEIGAISGFAIGGVIALEAMFAGPISGASMNPARSLAPALISGDMRSLWVYLTAPFLGAIMATAVAAALNPRSGKSIISSA